MTWLWTPWIFLARWLWAQFASSPSLLQPQLDLLLLGSVHSNLEADLEWTGMRWCSSNIRSKQTFFLIYNCHLLKYSTTLSSGYMNSLIHCAFVFYASRSNDKHFDLPTDLRTDLPAGLGSGLSSKSHTVLNMSCLGKVYMYLLSSKYGATTHCSVVLQRMMYVLVTMHISPIFFSYWPT